MAHGRTRDQPDKSFISASVFKWQSRHDRLKIERSVPSPLLGKKIKRCFLPDVGRLMTDHSMGRPFCRPTDGLSRDHAVGLLLQCRDEHVVCGTLSISWPRVTTVLAGRELLLFCVCDGHFRLGAIVASQLWLLFHNKNMFPVGFSTSPRPFQTNVVERSYDLLSAVFVFGRSLMKSVLWRLHFLYMSLLTQKC